MKKKLREKEMTNSVEVDVIINDEISWLERVDFDATKVANELASITFEHIKNNVEGSVLDAEKEFLLNVCLSNDEEVWNLNKEFRGMDKPTNVLSFANIDDDDFESMLEGDDKVELGDIIIAFETLEKEANEKCISVYAHYCHLLVHGFLHLLGFDHIEDDEATEMEGLEVEILEMFSIDNPYKDMEEI